MAGERSVLGVDAAGRLGWVGVVLDAAGTVTVHVALDLAALIHDAEADAPGPLAAIGVDIPIGLVDAPTRTADVAARRYVGVRRSSVFPAPHPEVVGLATYGEVGDRLRELGLPGMSRQGYNLFARIRETASVAAVDDRIIEVFPEASFRAMAGHELGSAKKTWAGQALRRRLLAAADPPLVVPDDIGAAGRCAPDDVLDAASAAWSARRFATGRAEALGDPDEVDSVTGRRIAVWV